MSDTYLFTSESVAAGHPDKIADQISDAILDNCLKQDPYSRVAVETLISHNLVVLAGEIHTDAKVDFEKVARETIHHIGYGKQGSGFNLETARFLFEINSQSPDISRGLIKVGPQGMGAGDQGLMFGYAVDETIELMPLPIKLAHDLMLKLRTCRLDLPFLRPDGKCQITLKYGQDGLPQHIQTVLLSVQHDEAISQEELRSELLPLIHLVIPSQHFDKESQILINPTGRFVTGGPQGDTGLTGRKIIVDTYGGRAHHGGGAFSGKDATKVDRSGAYAARYIAKHIVAAGLTRECEVQLAYAIGLPEPISLRVNTFSNSKRERDIEKVIREAFPLNPGDIIEAFELRKPVYFKTAFGGHFGRSAFTWEHIDEKKIKLLQKLL